MRPHEYVATEWLKGQSELFYLTGIKNSEFTLNCTLSKAVIILKNKKYVLSNSESVQCNFFILPRDSYA